MREHALFAVCGVLAIASSALASHQALGAQASIFGFSGSTCKCKSTPRPCLFIHGQNNGYQAKALQPMSTMFGDMKDHAPCCSSIKYASLNTIDTPWTDDNLQATVCAHALSVSKSSDLDKKIIANTILVTHSMGALIVAGALANAKCFLDKHTTWVSMSAPMMGTMASNYAQEVCTDDNTQAFQKIFAVLGKCPVGVGMKSLAAMGGKFSNVDLNRAYVAAQKVYRKHVSAVMCGNSAFGIVSTEQAGYIYLGFSAKHNSSEHDGFVTYDSCRGGLPRSQFTSSYKNRFYVSKCNHADTAFRHGDSFFRDSTKPVKWFECLL